jgi:CheY-like chemotaxis protein
VSQIRTLLIVEDDFDIRRVMRRMLSGMDFRIEEAADGVAALAAVAAHHPDVMILDLMMPEMNGLAVLDTLRDTGQIDGLSILVITGSITPASVLREKGAQGVLRKPFTRAELSDAVEAVAGHGAWTPPGYRGASR